MPNGVAPLCRYIYICVLVISPEQGIRCTTTSDGFVTSLSSSNHGCGARRLKWLCARCFRSTPCPASYFRCSDCAVKSAPSTRSDLIFMSTVHGYGCLSSPLYKASAHRSSLFRNRPFADHEVHRRFTRRRRARSRRQRRHAHAEHALRRDGCHSVRGVPGATAARLPSRGVLKRVDRSHGRAEQHPTRSTCTTARRLTYLNSQTR